MRGRGDRTQDSNLIGPTLLYVVKVSQDCTESRGLRVRRKSLMRRVFSDGGAVSKNVKTASRASGVAWRACACRVRAKTSECECDRDDDDEQTCPACFVLPFSGACTESLGVGILRR